jgi:competence protein ComEC
MEPIRPAADARSRAPLLPQLAIAAVLGAMLACAVGPPEARGALLVACGASAALLAIVALMMVFRALRPELARWMVLAAAGCLAAAWVAHRSPPLSSANGGSGGSSLGPTEARTLEGEGGMTILAPKERVLVRVRGRVTSIAPVDALSEQDLRAPGDQAATPPRWGERPERLTFALDEVEFLPSDRSGGGSGGGASQRVSDTILLRAPQDRRIDESRVLGLVGARVEALGWLSVRGAAPNPRPAGGAIASTVTLQPPDGRMAGSVTVERFDAIRMIDDASASPANLRDRIRQRIARELHRVMPSWCDADAWGLLHTMLLGRDALGNGEIERRFTHAGLAHLIAISGFNLAVLAGSITLLASACRAPPRLGESLSFLLIAGYVALVEPQASVTRSACCALGASAGMILARRWNPSSLLGAAALVILLADPEESLRPGFQLTFGAVIALAHCAPALHERWYGSVETPDRIGPWSREATRSLLTTTIAVWLVTTPIAVWHFGRVTPLAVPLSILAIPLGSAVLVLGYCTAALSVVATSLAIPFAWLAAAALEALIALAGWGASASEPLLPLFPAPFLWCAAAAAAAFWWCRARRAGVRSIARLLLLLIWIPPLAAVLVHDRWLRPRPAFAITMLAVGDGSAYLVESGPTTVIVDAGSTSTTTAGRTILLPALAEARVRSVDAIVVTHPDLDHYSAVSDILRAIPVGELIVGERFHAVAEALPEGSEAALLATAKGEGVPIRTVTAGEERTFGSLQWRWLHPPPGFDAKRDNDTSQVILIEAIHASATCRALFLGDIEAFGAVALQRSRILLDAIGERGADIVELPHHGAWQPSLVPMLAALRPAVMLQSTAERRFARDRWHTVWEEIGGPRRLVSCRDQAVRLTLDAEGPWLRCERWEGRRWVGAGKIDLRSSNERPQRRPEQLPGGARGARRQRSGRITTARRISTASRIGPSSPSEISIDQFVVASGSTTGIGSLDAIIRRRRSSRSPSRRITSQSVQAGSGSKMRSSATIVQPSIGISNATRAGPRTTIGAAPPDQTPPKRSGHATATRGVSPA